MYLSALKRRNFGKPVNFGLGLKGLYLVLLFFFVMFLIADFQIYALNCCTF